jgi:hypothetical protein
VLTQHWPWSVSSSSSRSSSTSRWGLGCCCTWNVHNCVARAQCLAVGVVCMSGCAPQLGGPGDSSQPCWPCPLHPVAFVPPPHPSPHS